MRRSSRPAAFSAHARTRDALHAHTPLRARASSSAERAAGRTNAPSSDSGQRYRRRTARAPACPGWRRSTRDPTAS